MRLLLDTHILLWAFSDDARLPQAAREKIANGQNEKLYSIASIWEVAIKRMAHPDRMPLFGKELSVLCHKAGYSLLPIRERHIFQMERLHRLPDMPEHMDPFDRIMLAQAMAEDILFITHDEKISQYEGAASYVCIV